MIDICQLWRVSGFVPKGAIIDQMGEIPGLTARALQNPYKLKR